MKIALYHNLPSGGAKRSLYESVRRLSKAHTIDLFVPATANQNFCDLTPFMRARHVFPYTPTRHLRRPLGRLNNSIRLFDLLRLSRLQLHVAREIDARDYDLVLVHPCQWTQGPAILKYLQTPTVYYCHESLRRFYEPPVPRQNGHHPNWRAAIDALDPLPGLLDRFVREGDQRATRSASVVVTNSQFTAAELKKIYGIEALVAYHGVDTDVFHPLEAEREPFVLSVGALLPSKGFDFLIRSLARIPAQRRPRLVIVSNSVSGPEHQKLSTLANSLEVNVVFLNQISTSDLVKLYNQCLTLVYAPYREPFGLVLLEAMACGTPVISVKEGGPCESVVDGETGFLVDRDESLFAKAIELLAADASLRRRLGQQAAEHVRRYWTWDCAVNRLEQIFAQVISKHQHNSDHCHPDSSPTRSNEGRSHASSAQS